MFSKRALTLCAAFALLFLLLDQAVAVESDLDVVTQNAASSEPSYQFPGLASRLPIQLSLSVTEGYDDNAATSSSGGGSSFTTGALTFSYGLRNVRTKLDFTASAGGTYYPDLSGQNSGSSNQNYDLNEYVHLSLDHNISQRLSMSIGLDAAYRTEPDFTTNAGPETRQGNYFQGSGNLSSTYHWTQSISTVTSFYGLRIAYDNSTVAALEDRWQATAGEQFQFTLPLHRATALVAEYRYEIINYDTFPRDSTTHFVLGGFDENFSPKFKLTARAGVSLRSYQNNIDRTDPHFETSLEYAGAHHFLIAWRTSYGVEEPNSPDLLDSTTFRTGVEAGYNLLSRLRSTAAVYYHHDDNRPFPVLTGIIPESSLSSDSVDLSLGLYYAVNRFLFLNLAYSHSEVSSGGSGVTSDYSRNSYSGGFTLTY